MIVSSAAVDLVLNSVTYSADLTVNLAWNPTPNTTDSSFNVVSASIEAQATTDVPDQVRFETGYPTIAASFVLGGLMDRTDATKTAAWAFRRWSSTSPLYGTDVLRYPVSIDVNIATATTVETIRKFTGYVDSYLCNPDGTVEFTCVDKTALLKATPAIQPVATAAPWNADLDAEFAVDAVLRNASDTLISSWLPQRPNCMLAVGLRGSLTPEVGTLDITRSQPNPTFSPSGPYGTGLTGFDTSLTGNNNIVWQLDHSPTGSIFMEFLISGMQTGLTAPVQLTVGSIQSGGIIAGRGATYYVGGITLSALNGSVQISGSGWSQSLAGTPNDGGVHYVAANLNWTSGIQSWSGTLYLDGTSQSFSGVTADPNPPSSLVLAGLVTQATATASVQVSAGAGASAYPFTPTAVIDPSLNPLEVVPAIAQGSSAVSVVQAIAAAELALAGFDESGIFYYRNRQNIAAQGLARTLTSSASLASITEETLAAAVINHARVGFSGWSTAAARSNVYALTGKWMIPARSTGRLTVQRSLKLDSLAVGIDTTLAALPASATSSQIGSYYAASLDRFGLNPHPGLTVTVTPTSSAEALLTIVNPTNKNAWLVTCGSVQTSSTLPSGTPWLTVAGYALTQDTESIAHYQYPAVSDGGAASSRFGEVTWDFTGSPWVQDPDTATQLAQAVVTDTYIPRPNVTNVEILPDPRLQLADLVRITDPDWTGIDDYARIFGWTFTADTGGWGMTVDARMLGVPGAWLAGIAGRSEAGTTTYAPAE